MNKLRDRLFLLLLCLLLTLILLPASAREDGAADFTYTETTDEETGITTVTVTGYTSGATAVTIPGTINGHAVTTVDRAFDRNTTIQSVTVPATVTSIGNSAFYGCTALETVTFAGTPTP